MNLVFELWSLQITPELWVGSLDFNCNIELYTNIKSSLIEVGITVDKDSYFDKGGSRIYLDEDMGNIEKLKELIKVIKSYGGTVLMAYQNGLGAWWNKINNIVEDVCEALDCNVTWFMDNNDEICRSYARLVRDMCFELKVECKLENDLDRYNLGDYEIVELKIENGKIFIQ